MQSANSFPLKRKRGKVLIRKYTFNYFKVLNFLFSNQNIAKFSLFYIKTPRWFRKLSQNIDLISVFQRNLRENIALSTLLYFIQLCWKIYFFVYWFCQHTFYNTIHLGTSFEFKAGLIYDSTKGQQLFLRSLSFLIHFL